MLTIPSPGLYKSNETNCIYEVMTIAHQTETNKDFVIYKQCFDAQKVFARTLDAWNERVIVNGIQKPRFKPYDPNAVIEVKTPEQYLSEYFGYHKFRSNQETIINNIISGKDTLNILPTGGGKSICFQIPALMMEGLTVVISPLISLMLNQVDNLQMSGISAAFYNSNLTIDNRERIITCIKKNTLKLLYLAPEQFHNERLMGTLFSAHVSMVVVDEAHCVSQWGHDFRPEYAHIKSFVEKFKSRPVVAAFTATATETETNDIALLLGLQNPVITRASVDRPNLYFSVLKSQNRKINLVNLVNARKGKSGIVYCATRRNVEECCKALNNAGIPAVPYHAGLLEEQRNESQQAFMDGSVDVIVATNAFGMGIDKPDVEYVIHFNMPKSLESYYQEAGRAGRDGSDAECILLYNAEDIHTQQFLLQKNMPQNQDPAIVQRVREENARRLRDMIWYATFPDCLRQRILTYFGEQAGTHCGHCYNCDHVHREFDATNESVAILQCVNAANGSFGMGTIIDVLSGSNAKKIINNRRLSGNPAYGQLRHIGKRQVWLIVNHLLSIGLLALAETTVQDRTVFLLKIGDREKAKRVINGNEKVTLFLPDDSALTQAPAARTSLQAEDDALYEELRQLRNRIACEEGYRNFFIIMGNNTLREMATRRPQTKEEMLSINGMGERRMRKYGQRFLDLINEFCANGRS